MLSHIRLQNESTALIIACGHVKTVRLLLDHGADMDHQNKVISLGLNRELAIFIMEVILFNKIGQSALWCASEAGESECVELLLKYGAQVDLPVRCDVQKWIQGCGVSFS